MYTTMRKKSFVLMAFVAIVFAPAFADKEPRINLDQREGKLVESGGLLDRPYVGYSIVKSETVGYWFWKKTNVECRNPGKEVCKAVIGGTTYLFLTSADEKQQYSFNSEVIMSAVNAVIEEIEQIPLEENGRKGEKTKKISAYDTDGKQRLISIRCVYNMDTNLNGSTQVYIDVVE